MKTRFRESFAKDLSSITDAALLRRIRRAIEQVESALTFQQIAHLKRLEARGKYFRIRVGNYRRGFVFEDGAVTFVRCLDRKEVYRYFPRSSRARVELINRMTRHNLVGRMRRQVRGAVTFWEL